MPPGVCPKGPFRVHEKGPWHYVTAPTASRIAGGDPYPTGSYSVSYCLIFRGVLISQQRIILLVQDTVLVT